MREFGPATAPSILFFHGGGAGGWMWQPQVDRLPEYHCLVVDLPEHGRSMHVKPFSIRLAAGLIADLIETQAHGRRAHITGLSLGAQVGVQLLARSPEKVDHALLSSPLIHPIPGTGWLTPGLVAASYRWFLQPFKNNDFWIRLNMRYSAGIPDPYYAQFKEEFQRTTKDSFVHVMVENQAFRLPKGLEHAQAPTLLVAGQREYGAMRQSVRDLAAVLPKGRAYEILFPKGVGLAAQHNWSLTAPQLFTDTLRAWIENQPLPKSLRPLDPT